MRTQISNFPQQKTTFKGVSNSALDLATKGLSMCDKFPMVNVSVTDVVTSIAPRTILDAKTGIPAAAETFRRESSGLLVNCLLPSFFVLGVSKLIGKPIMGDKFKNVDMTSSWANGQTLDKFVDSLKAVKPNLNVPVTKEEMGGFVKNIFENIEGLNGDKWVQFKDGINTENGKKAVDKIVDTIFDDNSSRKSTKKAISDALELIVGETHSAQNLRFVDKEGFSSTLSELLRDQIDIGKKFRNQSVVSNLDAFKKSATKLVNSKSLLGLGIVIPLAMSMQSINRAITRKKYNVKGAPIYKDFEKGGTHKEMTPAEKTKFATQKALSAAGMFGLAILSMMKKPSMKMFQFKGMFPTLDQCRWIAASTFASRFLASEDPNELRESTVRDMASFAGLYFLGDYAAKGVATLIEKVKPDIKLLNKNYVKNDTDSIIKKAGNWIKRTSVKSFDEVLPNAKNMRSVCQLTSLGFSIVALGLVLPAYNRHVTNKKVAKQKELEAQMQNENSKLITELREDKLIGKDGIFHTVAKDCFK